MTSLAEQLKKLAVPQTSIYVQERQKPSLLFDPKEAANLDRETVFSIGLNGLEELVLLDKLFENFHSSLFAESSKLLERSVQTKTVNENLDKEIKRFLCLLSPYFMLKPAHKALEWLFYRFHIESYNTDDIIACILPYHESNIFVRLIQILDLRNPTGRWHWLMPIQKPGVPLSKLTMLTHCYKNVSMMKFVCDLVPQAIQVHGSESKSSLRTVINFYLTSVIGALESMGDSSEETISMLLPYILSGLKSSVVDYNAATYMILCQLMRKSHLSEKLLRELICRIVSNLNPYLLKEGICCLLLMFQHQSVTSFPSKARTELENNKSFLPTLKSISVEHYVAPFLSAYCRSSILDLVDQCKDTDNDNEIRDLIVFIQEISLEKDEIIELIRYLIEQYTTSVQTEQSQIKKKLTKVTANILNQVERRYPYFFDEAISHLRDSPVVDKLLLKINPNPVLNINHINVTIRSNATKKLVHMVENHQVDDKESVCKLLLDRLKDDDPKIVRCVLQLGKKLSDIIDECSLLTTLMKISSLDHSVDRQEWLDIKRQMIRLLCDLTAESASHEMKWSVVIRLLPYLYCSSKKQKKILKEILTSNLRESFPIISSVHDAWMELINEDEDKKRDNNFMCKFNFKIIKTLTSWIKCSDSSTKLQISNAIIQVMKSSSDDDDNADDIIRNFLILLIQPCLLEKPACSHFSSLLENISEVLKRITEKKFVAIPVTADRLNFDESFMSLCHPHLKRKSLPSCMMTWCFSAILSDLKFPAELQGISCWYIYKSDSSYKDQYLNFVSRVFNNLHKMSNQNGSPSATQLMHYLSRDNFPDLKMSVTFLLALCSQGFIDGSFDDHLISTEPSMIVCALKTVALMFSEEKDLDWCLDGPFSIMPTMLVILSQGDEEMRSAAFTCLNIVNEHSQGSKTVYGNFLAHLLHNKDEIIVDASCLSQSINQFHENYSSSGSKNKRKCEHSNSILAEILNVIIDANVEAYVKSALLDCIRLMDLVEILRSLTPLFGVLVTKLEKSILSGSEYQVLSKIIHYLYVPSAASSFNDVDQEEYKMFITALKVDKNLRSDITLQVMVIEQITKEFFCQIPAVSVQQNLISAIIDVDLASNCPSTASVISHCLKRVSLDSQLIINELLGLMDDSSAIKKFSEARKVRRTAKVVAKDIAVDNLREDKLNRLIIILEAIQNKKKIKNVDRLVPVLFELLKRSLNLSYENIDYIKQLLLSTINNCCEKLTKCEESPNVLTEEQFSVELIVECMRSSKSPQTQHQALILLSHAARHFPDYVLHSVMTVFTFMGANILMQDDSYSFQVITNTIEAIIPVVIRNQVDSDPCRKSSVASVIRVFIDALDDIPVHRRDALFTKLLSTLQPSEEYIWMTMVLVMGHVVDKHQSNDGSFEHIRQHRKLSDKSESNDYSQSLSEFGLNLCHNFSPELQIFTCQQLMSYLTQLPDHKENKKAQKKNKMEKDVAEILFNVSNHSDKQLRHLKFLIVTFMTQLLSSNAFIRQVVNKSEDDVLESGYEELIEATLLYIKEVSHSVIKFSSEPTAKFWKALLNRTYDILDKINGLLPSNTFISVIKKLMSNDLTLIRRKAMEILNSKLQNQIDFFSADDASLLLDLLPPLTDVIGGSSVDKEASINKQTALYAMKLLARAIGQIYKKEFVEVLSVVLKVYENESMAVRSSLLLCLAELVSCLGPHVISSLPTIVPLIVGSLDDEDSSGRFEPLILSAVTTMHKLLEHLPHFLSPYLKSFILKVSILSSRYQNDDEKNTKSILQLRLVSIQSMLSTSIPPRLLIPAIKECYPCLEEKNTNGIRTLMYMLSERIKMMEKSDISSNMVALQNFFLMALNYRSTNKMDRLELVTNIEEHIIDAFICLVLKLSESSFKPLFFQLFNWATQTEDKIDTIVTFYRLTDKMAETLKGLFVMFAGNLVKHAVGILNRSIHDTDKSSTLLKYVIDTLYRCFLYDQDGFLNKERFDTLMQPLVDQLEDFTGGQEAYKDRVENHLCRCIAQFAVDVGDDISWKQLNYQVLLKTRHMSPTVRYSALHCTLEICKKLGDDFTSLLPETVPFLAELMEDESFEVEKKCQNVISEIETIVGESLQEYF